VFREQLNSRGDVWSRVFSMMQEGPGGQKSLASLDTTCGKSL
jgi:hypothetical protein